MPTSEVIRWMASAMARTCASDSMTQGPAMRKSRPSPTCTGPISKEFLTKAILSCREGDGRGGTGNRGLLRTAPGPLPKRPLERVKGRRAGKIALRLDDSAIGQVLAKGDIFDIELDVVPRVPQCFQSAKIQHGVALRSDCGKNRGGDGKVNAAQLGKSIDRVAGRGGRRSCYRQNLLDLRFAVSNQIVNYAFGFPANDRLQVCQCEFAVSNRLSGIECRSLKLLFFFAGLLPILLSQKLKIRFRGLKLKVRHGA